MMMRRRMLMIYLNYNPTTRQEERIEKLGSK
jgi:hypothetical protein